MSAIDEHDAWHDDREEARSTPGWDEPPDRPDAEQLLDLADYMAPDVEDYR